MVNSSLERIVIKGDDGSAIAYVSRGVVYGKTTGVRVATLVGGNLYDTSGQLLGCLTPSGSVRGSGGVGPENFTKLFD
jgi:hypothetical protein